MVKSGRTIEKTYNATDAHNNYLFKRGLSKGEYKLRKYTKMAKFIEDKIKIDKWAPNVIVGYMKTHNYFKKMVSVKLLFLLFIMLLDMVLLKSLCLATKKISKN